MEDPVWGLSGPNSLSGDVFFVDFEKELKKNGLFLKSIPSKDRSEHLCSLAVHQTSKALRYVPYKLQSESLCKYAIKKGDIYSVVNMIKKIEKLYLIDSFSVDELEVSKIDNLTCIMKYLELYDGKVKMWECYF